MVQSKPCETCGRPLVPQPRALHKRFCCNSCRQAWHSAQRAEVAAELKARREAAEAQTAAEEAVKVAERYRDGNPSAIASVEWTAGKVAAAIRALKEPT